MKRVAWNTKAAFVVGFFLVIAGCARNSASVDGQHLPSPAASGILMMTPEQPMVGHEYTVLGPVEIRGPHVCRSPEELANIAVVEYPQVDAIVDYRKFDNGCEGTAVEFVKMAR